MTRLLLLLLVPSLCMFAQAQHESIRLDSLMSSIYAGGKPGAAIAVIKGGTVLFKKGYGVADLGTLAPITPSTNFNICSLTKQFTAYAVLQLCQAGKVSLDDRLSRFFPGFTPRIASSVTVRHLLTHSSGLREHYAYVDRAQYREFWDKDVLATLNNVDTLNFSPGSRYTYSNAAFCILSQIIEQVSGELYPAYLQHRILAPLGMDRSKMIQPDFSIAYRAMGYDCETDTIRLSDAKQSLFFSTMGDGGLYTSLDDYLKWIVAIQDERILEPELVRAARSAQFPIDTARGLSYGYGWFVAGARDRQVVYHTGSNGGFRTIVFTKPSAKYAVVLFSNRTGVDLEDLVRSINRICGIDDTACVKLDSLIS